MEKGGRTGDQKYNLDKKPTLPIDRLSSPVTVEGATLKACGHKVGTPSMVVQGTFSVGSCE